MQQVFRIALDPIPKGRGLRALLVISGGELESWLKFLGASGHGPAWLVSVFEKMGEDPDSPDYLKPSTDEDVWSFMHKIKAWLVNANRKGIPS